MTSSTLSNFVPRHLGPTQKQQEFMLQTLGFKNLEALIQSVIPTSIRSKAPLKVGPGLNEQDMLTELKSLADQNQVFKSYIGMGSTATITPPVILRNILENPGWYTQYTPYQAEIAQGRLEALLNFQTMVSDLTGLPVANASLLDEATACAEAMHMCLAILEDHPSKNFFVAKGCHPQTLAVLKTRAEPLGINIIITHPDEFDFEQCGAFGCLLAYPATNGTLEDPTPVIAKAKKAGALVVMTADLLNLILLKAPATLGADIVVGSAQRFGVPMGFGGPYAAYLATKDEYKRKVPGRIVGLSHDAHGQPAIRLALQTREQHIRREKATSNICTAQVLLAVVASMYAVYHGPCGLKDIALKIHKLTCLLAAGLEHLGIRVLNNHFCDTLFFTLTSNEAATLKKVTEQNKINLRFYPEGGVGITLDETTLAQDVEQLLKLIAQACNKPAPSLQDIDQTSWINKAIPAFFKRDTPFLTHPVFNSHHSETQMLRYIHKLQNRDLSLTVSMIPLGSCTMKLNATTEMLPITWDSFANLHPCAPLEQTQGYQKLVTQLGLWLADMTGFAAVSFQPNAGSQGEYAGLLAIRNFQKNLNQEHRNICLIPASAHGTNPASAVMAGLKVVVVKCDPQGNIDIADLKSKISEHQNNLSCFMVTYPSTHGVFEESIKEVCTLVHQAGGQVYMDGANMNALVGLCKPGEMGADVCHLNLHKTFCIPHGGGGPGMGPIAVASHLKDYLPGHPFDSGVSATGTGAISSAPLGSASILPIPYAYIRMMGTNGLTLATQIAILNANYMAKKLEAYYPVLYKGTHGLVAHECIVDCRQLKATSGIEVEDIAKRLMDYGFHAPTVSFPVPGTLMIEPTESESLDELDRFCEALICIRNEIKKIEEGLWDKKDNPLKKAPHTATMVSSNTWDHSYSREEAAYPASWLKENKFWPSVTRIDNVYGDRNLVCSCLSIEEFK